MLFKVFHDLEALEKEIGASNMENLKQRFSNYLGITRTYILEEKYIDKEWREEYSIVYSFTSYEDITPLTKRLHLFNEKFDDIKKAKKDSYLGYIVFRPVPSNRILKAILKPVKDAFKVGKDEQMFMPLCKFTTHIGSEEFSIDAFPFYCQDSMVTVCAHASMFMACLYMFKRHWGNRPTLKDFVKLTPTMFGRNTPSEALTPAQMLSILASIGYNVRLTSFKPLERKDTLECLTEIDTFVESALPPLLMYGDHVVLVVGHSLSREGKKEYIIFDDSSYHLQKLIGSTLFAFKVPSDILQKELEKQEWVFIGNFEFDRQYFPLKSVKILTDELIQTSLRKRIILAESKDIKVQLREALGIIEDFNFPHYLWLIEAYEKNILVGGVLLDASVHKYDYKGSLVALWNNQNVKFYKYNDTLIKTGATLVPFTNLREITN